MMDSLFKRVIPFKAPARGREAPSWCFWGSHDPERLIGELPVEVLHARIAEGCHQRTCHSIRNIIVAPWRMVDAVFASA